LKAARSIFPQGAFITKLLLARHAFHAAIGPFFDNFLAMGLTVFFRKVCFDTFLRWNRFAWPAKPG
jgi:hypothetical protein